jgi:hypothetical protein
MADDTATGERGEERRGRRAPVPSPAMLAVRLENLQRGHRAWRQKQGAAKRALAELYRELPVEELWRTVKPKLASAVALYLAGYEYPAIAAAIGYSGRPSSATSIMLLLRRPEAQRLIAEIRQKQFERIVAGDYRVTATARAAAPRIMSQVAALAGGIPGTDGRPEGKAARAADQIKAASLALEVAGHRIQRHQHEHLHAHLFAQMTDAELERLAEKAEWPERIKAMGMVLTPESAAYGSSALPGSCAPALERPATMTDARPPRPGHGR